MYRQVDDLTGWCSESYVDFYTTQYPDLSEIAYALPFPNLPDFVQICPYGIIVALKCPRLSANKF